MINRIAELVKNNYKGGISLELISGKTYSFDMSKTKCNLVNSGNYVTFGIDNSKSITINTNCIQTIIADQ